MVVLSANAVLDSDEDARGACSSVSFCSNLFSRYFRLPTSNFFTKMEEGFKGFLLYGGAVVVYFIVLNI